MVEKTSRGKQVIESQGVASSIFDYFSPLDRLKLQSVSKRLYEAIVPAILYNVPIPASTLLFERKRVEFYLCRWTDSRELKYWKLLEIGKTATVEELGFDEIYFQYWQVITDDEHLAWPLEDEAYLE